MAAKSSPAGGGSDDEGGGGQQQTAAVAKTPTKSFAELVLDPRLLRAVEKKGFGAPSRVQSECIPRALEGKDIVARARTGSGKTMAYLLPAIHRVLTSGKGRAGWQAIILVPTRELCEQVKEEAMSVAKHCGDNVISASAITAQGGAQQRLQLSSVGQIVITTPGRLASLMKSGAVHPRVITRSLEALVLDEADLLLSYGYEDDLKVIAPHIPRAVQCMLMSATISEDVNRLQGLVLHSPVVLDLLEAQSQGNSLGVAAEVEHVRFDCRKDDRLLVLMAALKLGALKRKVLVFVNSIDTGFKLRLFLERFGVRTALLNSELPLNSRHHILQEFNKGLFDYLIATDDIYAGTAQSSNKNQKPSKKQNAGGKKQKAGAAKDEEFGVTRGIDFRGVKTVVNFDMPNSVDGYTHRVGRTGRGGQHGLALSLITAQDEEMVSMIEDKLGKSGTKQDEGDESIPAGGLEPFARLTKKSVEGLRYRAEDIARSITKTAVKEARAKELRLEMLNSERLKNHFEERPGDLALLKHDKLLHKTQELTHLKHIPQYLKDPDAVTGRSATGNRGKGQMSHKKRLKQKTKLDPLKAITGFVKSSKREEELTDMEKRAEEWAKKNGSKRKEAPAPMLKRNVKKRRG